MNAFSDNYLMLKVKNGDLDKMGLLFERYHRPLYGFLFHNTHQRATSEDLTQTVFYRMLKYRHTFTDQGEFRTWMYHLARNVLIDHHKKNQKVVFRDDLSSFEGSFSENIIDADINRNEENALLQNALIKLNPEQKEVLILARFQELSYKEIAEIMQTTEGNIKVKVHRAITALKEIFLGNE